MSTLPALNRTLILFRQQCVQLKAHFPTSAADGKTMCPCPGLGELKEVTRHSFWEVSEERQSQWYLFSALDLPLCPLWSAELMLEMEQPFCQH